MKSTALIAGVGNYDKSENHSTDKIYIIWKHMLQRCYVPSIQIKQPSYKNVKVCNEWLTYSTFEKWVLTQDYKNKELDKDILVIKNKLYSADTCLFVTRKINRLLSPFGYTHSKHLQGVTKSKCGKKFVSKISINGNRLNLGTYISEEQAHAAYCKSKSKAINDLAIIETNNTLKTALLNWSKHYKDKSNASK